MTPRRRVLVTGAGGFVGANLTRRLIEDGHEVSTVERPGSTGDRLDGLAIERSAVDLRERDAVVELLAQQRPEWVFHLAAHGAYSWQTDSHGILESNFRGTVNVVDACVLTGCDVLVNTGSSSEYGYCDRPPVESDAPRPNSDYAVAKAAATLYVGHAGREGGHRFATLRLYSVYGPWEDERRLVPTLIECGLRGELPPLVNPDVARDFVHVDDVVDAYLRAAQSDGLEAGGIYNVGSGTQTTIRQIVTVARSVMQIERKPDWGSMPDRQWDTNVWVSDSGKAARELGWSARTDIESGLQRTVEWVRTRRSRQ
jgi:UDP-glucose 4-epimerase